MVWTPELGAEAGHVPAAAELINDPRVTHYWDPEALVGKSFQAIVGSAEPAWDVWMLFDRDAMWREDRPPRPAWWEHQLHGLPPERLLDPKRFADKAARLYQGLP